MTPERREILEKVASGELTPEEADRLLREDGAGEPAAAKATDADRPSTTTIRRVRVDAGFGAVSITGDPTVTEAEIDGMHSASVDGDTLVIASEFGDVGPGTFSINLGGRGRRIRVNTGSGARGIIATRGASALRIRMNPDLELDAKLDAGPLHIRGITAPIRARSSAGPIAIDGVRSPVDVAVNAGAIRINGLFTEGESRVRSDAGAIRIELDEGSNVTVSADAALGKIVLPGMTDGGRKAFGSRCEATIGDGAATLRVETAMGSIIVSC